MRAAARSVAVLTIGEDFYLITYRPTANEFIGLRAAVGWTEPPHDVAERALANSLHVVCLRLRSDAQLVGFGRITGDRAMRFYIEDVAILAGAAGRARQTPRPGERRRDASGRRGDRRFRARRPRCREL